MDDQYNQQNHANFNQEGNAYQPGQSYQQGNAYQPGQSYQQGNVYQQGNSYQQGQYYRQGSSYQQGNPYQQGNVYQQGQYYQQGNPYQQGTSYQQGNPYQQGTSYQQGNPYQQGSPYQQGTYQQSSSYQQGNTYMGGSYRGQDSSYNYGGNSESQKAPNIFQQFVLSFIPFRYEGLTRVTTGSMIGFVTLLALIATVISFISLAISFSPAELQTWTNKLPDFEIRDGHLFIEEDFLYDEDDMFVYMTEDIDAFTYEDAANLAAEGYQSIILVGRDRVSSMQNWEYQQGDFDNLAGEIEISKTWIVDTLLPMLKIVAIFGYVIFFVGRVLWYFLCAAVYLLFAMLIASVMKKQQSAGALYRVAVYSKVLMFVIAALLSELSFVHFSVPLMLRAAITIAFMGVAIAKLPGKN